MSDTPRTLKDLIGDPMKPREFWITESRCTGKQKAHKTQLECWGEIQHNDNEYHVIEYAAYEKLKTENERLASGLYRDDHRYHPLKETCDQLREENERLKAERDAIKSEHKRRLIDFEHNKSWVAAWMQERDTLKAKLAEVEAERDHFARMVDRYTLGEIARLESELTREREAAKVLRNAISEAIHQTFEDELLTTDEQYENHFLVKALAKADEIRGKK